MKSFNNLNENNINHINQILNSGGIIIYPTETVWALGCNALLPKAVEKIYEIKKREASSPLISLLSEYNEVKRYTSKIEFNNSLEEFIENPPTIIYQNCSQELKHLSNSKNEIALRVTPISYLKKIIKNIDSPIVSTSANISGEPTPKNFRSINELILKSVDLILNFEIKSSGKPSTIIKFNPKGEIQYIRK